MMGTTVTPNLSLIKPDRNESIKANLPTFAGWAVQQGLNADAIDAVFRNSSHSFTPVWTADVTNPTLGTGGFVQGKWLRLHPRMVLYYYQIFMGTTGFSAGSGFYQLTLPVAVATEMTTINDSTGIGKAHYFDSDAVATSTAFTAMYNQIGAQMFMKKPDGDAWRSTTPVTPGQSDRLTGYAIYPTGAA
jgi:hypothetical protein